MGERGWTYGLAPLIGLFLLLVMVVELSGVRVTVGEETCAWPVAGWHGISAVISAGSIVMRTVARRFFAQDRAVWWRLL